MFNIKELCDIFGHDCCDDSVSNTVISSVDHDTRRLKAGSLYIAIKGDNLDGHDFIKDAVAKGAKACVVEKRMADVSVFQLVVKDSIKAYGEIASYWRSKIKYPIVAVTGSNGKTTTKDMLYAVLSFKNKTVATDGNFNNLIGVPYTILNFPIDADFGIVEMGMNAKSEIAQLANIAKPDAAIITNIGRAHIGLLGSIEQIFKAKMELFDYTIANNGSVCVNLSDPMMLKWFESAKLKVPYITYGVDGKNLPPVEVKAVPLSTANGREKFNVIVNDLCLDAEIPVIGLHNIQNACSAISAGILLGLEAKDCVDAIKNYKGSKLRSTILEKDGVIYFVDCYNANPDSMRVAIDSTFEYSNKGKKVAVLGDMLELQAMSEQLHNEIGNYVGLKGFDMVFFYGNYAQQYADGFIKAVGHNPNVKTYAFGKIVDLKNDLIALVKKGDVVLVKGSRGMKLEDIL